MSCARTAEPIDLPFGLWTRWAGGSTRSIELGKAQWRHLANTIEPSVCGGDAVLCQITLTTCYAYTLHIFKCLFLLVLISQGLSGFHGCKFCILRFVSSLCRYGRIAAMCIMHSVCSRPIFTFCVSRRRRKMYCGHASVCLCVCLSVRGRKSHTTARTRM